MNARNEIVPLKKGGGGGLPSWERNSPTEKGGRLPSFQYKEV